VAAFFYLRLIVVMYMADDQVMAGVGRRDGAGDGIGDGVPDGGGGVATAVATRVEIPVGAAIAIGLALAFTIGAGLVPQPIIDFARHASVLHL
jgi:NADH:ubiquinone oxidoreductase subunit 2 (subunit N)